MTHATPIPPSSLPRPLPRLLRLLLWSAALLIAMAGALTGQILLVVAAVGAMALAGLLPLYTRVSGIVLPPGLATGVLAFCLSAFVLGEAGELYKTSAVWDLALHFVASAVLGITGLALALLPTAGAPPRTPAWILGTLGVGFAALVGTGWEMLEFTIDALFGTNAQRSGLPDTMGDITVNTLGAIYGVAAAIRRLRGGARWPLSGLLPAFCQRNPVIYGAWTGRPFPAKTGPRPQRPEKAL